MKTLLLIRHAKSGWTNTQESDYERQINNTGKKEALLMSDKLFKKNIIINAFISSGALRARQTCEIFCNTYGYLLSKVLFSDILYQATPQNITDVVSSMNNETNSVAVFTHNPGITDFINHLELDVNIDDMPTCGVFSFQIKTNDWRLFNVAEKKYLFFDYPMKP